MKTSRGTLCITFSWTAVKESSIHHNYRPAGEHTVKLHVMPDYSVPFHNKWS